jgi:4-amino-4-deoxy-L-arabinose transferase-like glycosyltransferase
VHPPRYLLCGLLVACVLLRLRYGQGLAFTDDFAYVNAALDANTEGWLSFSTSIASIYENRLSLVLPLALSMRVFGASEFALWALGLFFSLGSIALGFSIARRLHDEWAGWFAALLIAALPQEVWFSTSLLPDTAMPFYTGLALDCTLRAQRRPITSSGLCWYAAAALAVFGAFEARATGGVVLGVLGMWGLLQPSHRLLRAALPGMLFGVFVAGFWGLLGWLGGDPAIQIRQLVEDGTGTRWTGTGKPLQHLFFMLPPLRLLWDLPHLLVRDAGWSLRDLARYGINTFLGTHYYIVWPAAIYALLRWRALPAARLPLIAFGLLYAFFEFGSTSLTSYQPIWKYERFLTILTVPSAVLAGIAIADRFARGPTPVRDWKLALVASSYIALSAALLEANHRHWGNPVDAVKQTFARIKQQPQLPGLVYTTDSRWSQRGEVLLRLPPARPMRFELLSGQQLERIGNAVVIVDRSRFESWSEMHDEPASFDPRLAAGRLPPDWQLLFQVPVLSVDRHASVVQVFAVR